MVTTYIQQYTPAKIIFVFAFDVLPIIKGSLGLNTNQGLGFMGSLKMLSRRRRRRKISRFEKFV